MRNSAIVVLTGPLKVLLSTLYIASSVSGGIWSKKPPRCFLTNFVVTWFKIVSHFNLYNLHNLNTSQPLNTAFFACVLCFLQFILSGLI